MSVAIMKTSAGITIIRRRQALMLAGTMSLLLLPAADSQKPEELTVHVHVTCVGKYDLHKSDGSNRVDETDQITIEYDATSHDTAPPGTPPWQMSTGTTDYHFTVSGSGTGSDDDIRLSWTWKLVDAAKGSRELVTNLGPGEFEVALPDFQNDAKIEPQMQLEDAGKSKNWLEAEAKQAAAGLAIHPVANFAATSFDTPASYQDYDAVGQFHDQLKGTFDQNAKSFTKSGSASRSYSNPLGMTTSIKIAYSLSFNQQPEDAEAILIPRDGYEQWMPKAGHDEDTPGNGLLVNVVLQKKDKPGEKPRAKAKSFKFELIGVSKEPGVCLNGPSKSTTKADPDFDLKFDRAANPSLKVAADGQSATDDGGSQQSSVIVFSYDWGGWGSLQVTVELDNNQTVVAHLQNRPGVTELKIPKDDNGNHIADEWEKKIKDKAPEADDDKLEYQELAQGDGLSFYEEYRGFMVAGGAHIRTDPTVPDLFVYDQDGLNTGLLDSSGLAVHIVERNQVFLETDPDPNVNHLVINFNSHNQNLGKQHALWLRDANPGKGLAGKDFGGPGPPKTSQVVMVGMDAIKQAGYGDLYARVTVSHELAHAANVWHHGDNDYQVSRIWKLNPDASWASVPTPPECAHDRPGEGCYGVAAQGGQESGVQDCIMRYEQNNLYEWDAGPYRWMKGNGFQRGGFYGDAQPSGTVYCRAVQGAGVNARAHPPAPLAGDATNGNCEAQFCTNDLKRCWFKPTYAKQ